MVKLWYTIWDLSSYLNISEDDIERLFFLGKLTPCICLSSTPLTLLDASGTTKCGVAEKHGMFEIMGYEKISWDYSWQADATTCDLYEARIRLLQGSDVYGFSARYTASRDDILIMRESIQRYEVENTVASNTSIAPAYLDPNHMYHSEELATAVNVWLELFGNNEIKKNRGYKDQLKAKLSGKGFSHAAVERIATLVNPKKEGGAPPID